MTIYSLTLAAKCSARLWVMLLAFACLLCCPTYGSSQIITVIDIIDRDTLTDSAPSRTVNIFPNPSTDYVTVQTPGTNSQQEISLVNHAHISLAQIILTARPRSTWNLHINLAGLPPDTYYVKISDPQKVRLIPFVLISH